LDVAKQSLFVTHPTKLRPLHDENVADQA
jgi:hypothetical protein